MKERHARLCGLSTTYITEVGTALVRHTSPGDMAHFVVVTKPNATHPWLTASTELRGAIVAGRWRLLHVGGYMSRLHQTIFMARKTLDIQTYRVTNLTK